MRDIESESPAPSCQDEHRANAENLEQQDDTRAESAPQEEPEHDACEFDWTQEEVVVPEQLALAVYHNTRGDIVIRQQATAWVDKDSFIVVTPANAITLAQAIADAAGLELHFAGSGDVKPASFEHLSTAPKKSTGAERMRRHRERHSDGRERHARVTCDASPSLALEVKH
jgi:hypothetical protein